MIESIEFKNYKGFASEQKVDFKKITLLIGKNSSGKSAISKLMTLIDTSLSQTINSPLILLNDNVEIGKEFKDLVYKKRPPYEIEIAISFSDKRKLSVRILQENSKKELLILKWVFTNENNNVLELLYQENEKLYKDSAGAKYDCEFLGFIPKKIVKEGTQSNICSNLNLENLKINVDYIGPFRIIPPSIFSFTGKKNHQKVGIEGEEAYQILADSKLNNTPLLMGVSKWYTKYFDNWAFDIEDDKYPYLEPVLKQGQGRNEVKVNISQVGQGMSQALPLVVRAYMETIPSFVILEQPELHLHPAAHGDLAELFVESVFRNDNKYIIETHSENILLRLRKLIVDENSPLTSEDVIIYWIDSDEEEHNVKEITINENGVLSDWPDGVFNENHDEIIAIKKILKMKKQKNDSTN